MPNVLHIEFDCELERIYTFRSHTCGHVARMNVLDDHIVVEHDVDIVSSATFSLDERAKAIKWIEDLFTAFSYKSEEKREAYKAGRIAGFTHVDEDANPYTEQSLRNMWFRGYDNAVNSCIIIDESV